MILECSVRLYFQLFVAGLMSFLHYLCLFAHSGVQHIFCCVFVFLRLERYLYSDIVVPLVYYLILHYPVYNIQFKALISNIKTNF